MCRAAPRPPKRWSTASCNYRRKSVVPGRSSVAEAAPTEIQPSALQVLGQTVATLPGVLGTSIQLGELIVSARKESLVELMTTLRDEPRFAFEQVMDICGVDWPDRAERFDVVYNLLSLSNNQRLRVIVATDEQTPVPSVHTIWPAATWWERE